MVNLCSFTLEYIGTIFHKYSTYFVLPMHTIEIHLIFMKHRNVFLPIYKCM